MRILFDVDNLTEEQKKQVYFNLLTIKDYQYNTHRSSAHTFTTAKSYEVFPTDKIITSHDHYIITPETIVIRVKK